MQRLVAAAIVLQTLELLAIRSSFREDGVWAWSVLRREYRGWPLFLRLPLDLVLGDRGFLGLLVLRLLSAVLAPFWDCAGIWAFQWLSTVLVCMRWRGTFNGGSDYMTLIVLSAVTVGSAVSEAHPRWAMICGGYVAIQVCLSFFVAGMAKLGREEWRSGRALSGFLASNHYGVPVFLQGRIQGRGAQVASWLMMAFECLFPLALLDPRVCVVMIGLALLFQLVNAFVFGLNRFVWAWGAAYPALYWLSVYLSERS